MISVDAHGVLEALPTSHPVRALLLPCSRLPLDAVFELVSSRRSYLAHLHCLAVDIRNGEEAAPVMLQGLAQLVEAGQLPQLRSLLLMWGLTSADHLHGWAGGMVRLMHAGCAVHLLPANSSAARARVLAACVQQIRQAAHDPDMLQLGVRMDVHEEERNT